MLINLIRLLVIVLGPVIGYFQISPDAKGILIGVGAALLIIAVEIVVDRVALDALISGVIGAIVGLVAAQLVNWGVYQINNPRLFELVQKYSLLIHVVFAYLGLVIFVRKRTELELLDRDLLVKGGKRKSQTLHVLDTSALIDGRIVDVCTSKFLSGTLVVPRFVLQELQKIADSADNARRARGRRGMDMLARLQENPDMPAKVFEKDYPDIKEVDAKLVALARELGAKIITTDFNLNKVASLQGAVVLNVNDLANALKPVVLPGEVMSIFLVKEGKEKDQAIGYLDDGTMVVVEDGRRQIGHKLNVTVTSILQTSAGRMIFTRLKDKIQETKDPQMAAEPPASPSSEIPPK